MLQRYCIPNATYLGVVRYCQKSILNVVNNTAKKPRRQKPPPKTFRMNTELLRQKLAELIIELTDADLGEVSNIYEAIDCIIAEATS